jgi:catechol 2,3-dioxygenase-like lactoylglutathione lyase family enzyme
MQDMTMSDSTATEQGAQKWYARPVLFVSDLQVALRFYTDKLGFKKKWHARDGTGTVCQVDRGECEIILCKAGHFFCIRGSSTPQDALTCLATGDALGHSRCHPLETADGFWHEGHKEDRKV